MARRQCPVCHLYVGKKSHSGPMHDRILANQKRVKAGILGRGVRSLTRQKVPKLRRRRR